MTTLSTESGLEITTEDGQGILIERATSNGDIQFFDFSVNLLRAILWQYTTAANLQGILNAKNSWYFANQTDFWTNWIQNVFDLATADDFGLSVWSIILNQPIYITNGPAPLGKPTWGLGAFRKNFNNGNFSSNNGYTYRFPTEQARIILQLRYFQLVSSGTVPETNRMLQYVFRNYGDVYLQDRLDMTQRYVFQFKIPSWLILALNNFDLLPRPAGVRSSYYDATIARFGFGEYHANYNRGNFGS